MKKDALRAQRYLTQIKPEIVMPWSLGFAMTAVYEVCPSALTQALQV